MSKSTEWDPDERIDADRGTYDIQGDGVPAEERQSGTAGLPTEDNVPAETIETIERERAERLDPENRPETAEVDNTHRTFDAEAGKFTDSDEYDEGDRPFASPDEE
jgi:hypothetical protein